MLSTIVQDSGPLPSNFKTMHHHPPRIKEKKEEKPLGLKSQESKTKPKTITKTLLILRRKLGICCQTFQHFKCSRTMVLALTLTLISLNFDTVNTTTVATTNSVILQTEILIRDKINDNTPEMENVENSKNLRPFQHFSTTNFGASTISSLKHHVQGDEPGPSPAPQSVDNKSKKDKKLNKSSKKPISSLSPNSTRQSVISSFSSTSSQTQTNPRRLESLLPSHSHKNKILASSFVRNGEDEDGVLVESSGDEIAKHVQRKTIQIRRDLSRLVASVGAGTPIDDDTTTLNNNCDKIFISTPNGPKNGTFESPTLPVEEGNLYTCMLMFVARPNERVDISFSSFNVRGIPPECGHEWVDIWTEVEGTDPTDLITTPFSGRYCGRIPPRKRISLYGGIAIGFYSDKNATEEPIFDGSYAFINESMYMVGTPVPRTLCSYTILASSNKGKGELLSPTYPGVYPKNLSCSYKFTGSPGQRIRIEFRDFDVFSGGTHCPFDDVKIYDGSDLSAPLIGFYCGQQRNLVVYSSEHTMLVTFTALDRNLETQNRGFNAVYEFSNSFVKLDFIENNTGTHIRGTECDQRILSKTLSSGIVYSPNYPYPYVANHVCRYFLYGLQDAQNLERVRLSFEIFDVPSNVNSGEDEVNQSQSEAKSRCGDAFLKVYLKGQEVIQAYDKADYEFCGKELPHSVVSDGPRMILVFSSGETQGSGRFKGHYYFETEYRVPGTEDPTIPCRFHYHSGIRSKGGTGSFNSPRFPSNYPSSTNCSYIFYVENPKEQVRIVFDNFKLKADKFNDTTRGAYGSSCEEDWVEIWNIMPNQEDRLVGRYCGPTVPGPVESREEAIALKVLLHTDEEGVQSGFKARYIFFTPLNIYGDDCGGNISQLISGTITTPNWPAKYFNNEAPSSAQGGSKTCNWYITVRPGSRVMLNFHQFTIEGDPPSKPHKNRESLLEDSFTDRGCGAAAVRIWEDIDGTPTELCGQALPKDSTQFVSLRNTLRLTFIMADKAVGAPGFRAIWTEVQDGSSSSCHNSFFRCTKSNFCIPMELKCDKTRNCGIGTDDLEHDHSDEEDRTCVPGGIDIIGDMNLVFSITTGVVIGLFFLIVVCVYTSRKRKRRRRRLQLRRPPIHVCDNAGARFAAMDSV